jgi:3-oxoadipate enol-lactonase
MWDRLAAALAPTFTVLRYDTRGHGGSSAPAGPYGFDQLTADVVGLLDALHIERTHFVGLSMGGMIGQHLALAAPQRLDRLVIANSTSRIPPEAGPLWEERIAIARGQGCAGLVEGTLGRWFTPDFRAAHPAETARIGTLIANTPPAGYIGCAGAIRALDITARIGAIRAPTLVIAGADDPGTPPAMSEVITRAIPAARLEVIPSASHLSCIEQPETFNRLVTAFLKG